MERENKIELPIKIGIAGMINTGKTSFFKLFFKNQKFDKNEIPTENLNKEEIIYKFILKEDNPNLLDEDYEFLKSIKILFHDFPGTNMNGKDEMNIKNTIDKLNETYFNELDILYIVFNPSNLNSYNESKNLAQFCSLEPEKIILIGMKSDKPDKKVTNDLVKREVINDNPKIKYFELSATKKSNEKEFYSVLDKAIKNSEKYKFIKYMCIIKNLFSIYIEKSEKKKYDMNFEQYCKNLKYYLSKPLNELKSIFDSKEENSYRIDDIDPTTIIILQALWLRETDLKFKLTKNICDKCKNKKNKDFIIIESCLHSQCFNCVCDIISDVTNNTMKRNDFSNNSNLALCNINNCKGNITLSEAYKTGRITEDNIIENNQIFDERPCKECNSDNNLFNLFCCDERLCRDCIYKNWKDSENEFKCNQCDTVYDKIFVGGIYGFV